jgi:hypothetical protein
MSEREFEINIGDIPSDSDKKLDTVMGKTRSIFKITSQHIIDAQIGSVELANNILQIVFHSGIQITQIYPDTNWKEFKQYIPEIQDKMKKCFNIDGFNIFKGLKWSIIFIKNKMIGFIAVDYANIIRYICTTAIFRNKKIVLEALRYVVAKICMIGGTNPHIIVYKSAPNYMEMVSFYSKIGFRYVGDVQNDPNMLIMKYIC